MIPRRAQGTDATAPAALPSAAAPAPLPGVIRSVEELDAWWPRIAEAIWPMLRKIVRYDPFVRNDSLHAIYEELRHELSRGRTIPPLEGNLVGFVKRVGVRVCANVFRKWLRERKRTNVRETPLTDEVLATLATDAQSPSSGIEERERAAETAAALERIRACVDALTEKRQKVFRLFMDGLKVNEIAETLTLDHSTVSKALKFASDAVMRCYRGESPKPRPKRKQRPHFEPEVSE